MRRHVAQVRGLRLRRAQGEQEKYELGIDEHGFPILDPSFYDSDAAAGALWYQMIMERND